jgi:hypothetical protein
MVAKKKTVKKKSTGKKQSLAELGKPYRWQKGQSGNPNGRPKGQRPVAEQFKKQFDMPATILAPVKKRAEDLGIDPRTATIGDVFALSILADAIEGKDTMAKEVINRIDGKVPDIIKNEIINEAKASLDNLTDEQLRAMLGKQVKKENGNGNKKTTSRRARKKKSG